jgi:hypothetical protein
MSVWDSIRKRERAKIRPAPPEPPNKPKKAKAEPVVVEPEPVAEPEPVEEVIEDEPSA